MPPRNNSTNVPKTKTGKKTTSSVQVHVCPQCNHVTVTKTKSAKRGERFVDMKMDKLEKVTKTALKPLTATGSFIYGGMDRVGSALTSRIPSMIANKGTLMVDTLYEKSKPLTRMSNKAVSFAGYFLDPIAAQAARGGRNNTNARNKKA